MGRGTEPWGRSRVDARAFVVYEVEDLSYQFWVIFNSEEKYGMRVPNISRGDEKSMLKALLSVVVTQSTWR